MAKSSDIVIIGGGVIGLTTAFTLAREGLRVTVLDRRDFGQEASWAGAGIIPPGNPEYAVSPFDRLRAISSIRFPELSAELLERTGIDNGYWRCGGLEFATGDGASLPEEWRGAGVRVQALSEDQARQCEPALAAGLGSACLLPELAQLRNPRHLQALVAACHGLNVDLRPNCAARQWAWHGGRIEGVHCDKEIVRGDEYIVCAGAWTDALLTGLGLHLDVQPVRGQIVLLQPPVPLCRHVLLWGDRYLVPRRDGRVLAGSTEEHVGYDTRTTEAARQALLNLARRLVPALADAEVERSWAGLRPGSPDGLPYIGRVPGHEHVLVAAGHFRAGIQLSPGTAQLVKEMILGRPLAIAAEPFRLDRAAKSR
jgi:glycine oxidase